MRNDTHHQTTHLYCSSDECSESVPDHYWGHVKAAGWFFQKNGSSWCPAHVPEWVTKWRARKGSYSLKTWKRCPGSGQTYNLSWPRGAEEGYPGAAVCDDCTFGVLARKRPSDDEWVGVLRTHDVLWEDRTDQSGPAPVQMRYTGRTVAS